jgi:hypothetical protein
MSDGTDREPGAIRWIEDGGQPGEHLRPISTDHDIAYALRLRALEALEQLNAVCTEADRAGFVIAYATGQDGLGQYMVQQFRILKKMG